MRRLVLVLVVSALIVMTGEPSSGQDILTRSTLTNEQRVVGLSQLWREARFGFAYYGLVAENWDKWYREFIPRVLAATSDYAYYLELMRFYARLNDGHSGVFWPSVFDEALGYPPFEIRKVGGQAVIFRILRESDEIVRNGIRPGLAILRVDDRPVSELVDYWRALKTGSTDRATDRLAYFRILTGPRNSHVDLVLREPDGTTRTTRLTRSEKYFNDTNLNPLRMHATLNLDGDIAYFQANQMSPEVGEAFGSFIDAARPVRGLIVDVRYNGGGSDLVAFEMVRRLIDQPVDGPIYEATGYRPDRRAFRQDQEVIRTQGSILPAAGKRFTGWLVVLLGEQTHSATEGGFLSVIRGRARTIFIGEATAGSTGQPLVFPIEGGATGAVCSRRTLAPNGSPFVGIGFQPDLSVSLSHEDLFLNRDSVLERAVQFLKALPKP